VMRRRSFPRSRHTSSGDERFVSLSAPGRNELPAPGTRRQRPQGWRGNRHRGRNRRVRILHYVLLRRGQ
jgi:hypothetical protein